MPALFLSPELKEEGEKAEIVRKTRKVWQCDEAVLHRGGEAQHRLSGFRGNCLTFTALKESSDTTFLQVFHLLLHFISSPFIIPLPSPLFTLFHLHSALLFLLCLSSSLLSFHRFCFLSWPLIICPTPLSCPSHHFFFPHNFSHFILCLASRGGSSSVRGDLAWDGRWGGFKPSMDQSVWTEQWQLVRCPWAWNWTPGQVLWICGSPSL